MKRPAAGIRFLLIPIAVLLISSQAVYAKLEPEGKWNIEADQINYDQNSDQFIAEGAVVITSGDKKLTADSARYDKKNKVIYSEGNVILIAGDDILMGDKMQINAEEETGVIVNGSIFMKATHFTIRADRINKIGDNTYSAENGSISTCEGDNPDWRIDGSYIEVTLEGYGYVKHAALYVRRLPVMYSPFVYFPAKTKRQSGFLVPEFGYSDRKGAELNLPYFWAIDRSSDATIYSHSMTERGQKFGVEYRYVLHNGTMGTAMVDFLNDNKIEDGTPEATEKWGYEGEPGGTQILRENSDRYWFRMKHNHSFRGEVDAKVDLDILSDQDYLNEFKSGYSGFEKTNEYYVEMFGRGVDEYDESVRENKLDVYKGWTIFSLNTGAVWNDDVIARRTDDTDNTLQKMPFVDVDAKKTKLGGTPFYCDLTSGYNYFYRIDGTKGHRVDIYPRIYLPYNFENYFVFEPSAGLRETAWYINEYQNPSDDDEDYLHREIYDITLDLSSEVYSVFDTGFWGIDKIKHAIRPQVIYNFTPDIGTDDNPRFDDIDRIRETSEITYSISNYFTSRSEKPVFRKKLEETKGSSGDGPYNMDKPTYDYREFCRFKLSQTYDIKAAWENNPEPFSPIKGELDFSPIRYLVMSGEARYSRYSTRFVSYDASVEISDYRGDRLLLERRYRESVPSETVKLGFHLVMTDRLYAYGSTEHNLVDEKNVETELGLVYTAQCWSTGASYYDSQNEQRYRFTVNLHGLGELGHSVKNE